MQPLVSSVSTSAATATDLHLRVIREFSELEALASQWRALLEKSSTNEPMLSPIWLLTWWRVYGANRQLAVGLFCDGERLVGLAPLMRRRFWHRPGIPYRRLELLGADGEEHDGVSSEYLNVIAEAGQEERVADAFASAAVRGEFGVWDEINLPALAGDSPMTGMVKEAFRRGGCFVHEELITSAPHIVLPATWDEYLKALPKKHRYHVLRAQRDFDKWAGNTAVLHRADTPAKVTEGKRILADLHTQRWRAAGASGAFSNARFTTFHDAILPQLQADNALELLWLTVHGQPVAAMYSLVWNNKIYFYQSGRKLDVPPHQRVGIVIISHAIRGAINARRREFDFLGGDSRYKKQLTLTSRPLVRLRIARRTIRESVHRLADRGIDGLRALRNAGRTAWRRLRGFDPARTEQNTSTANSQPGRE